MSIDELTWTCHICGDERPDAKISVHKRDTSAEYGLPEGTTQENVRYCNDRPACVEGAQTYRHHKPEATMDFMEDWKGKVLTLTRTATSLRSDEADYERTVIVLVQTPHGNLDAALELCEAWPSLGDPPALLFDSGRELSRDEAVKIVQRLLGRPELQFGDEDEDETPFCCTSCGKGVVYDEGPCPYCGADLELDAVATGPCSPFPADTEMPVPTVAEAACEAPCGPPVEIPGWHRLWRNGLVHDVLAHPMAGILRLFRFHQWAVAVLSCTEPSKTGKGVRG